MDDATAGAPARPRSGKGSDGPPPAKPDSGKPVKRTVYYPKDEWDAIKDAAELEDRTAAALIRVAVRWYLEQAGRR